MLLGKLDNFKYHLVLCVSCVIFASIGIFINEIKGMLLVSVIFYRQFFGFVGLILVLILCKKSGELRLFGNKKYLFLLGLCNITTMAAYFYSIKYTSISTAVLLLHGAPVYVTLISPILLKEKITGRSLTALFLSLAGILLIVSNDGGNFAKGPNYLTGLFMGVLAGFCYAGMILTARYLRDDYSEIGQLFWSTLTGTVLLLPIAFMFPVPGPVLAANLKLLIAFGVLTTTVAYLLYICGVMHLKAQVSGVLSMLEPVSSIALANLFLGEIVTFDMAAGCVLILMGAGFVSLEKPGLGPNPSGRFKETVLRNSFLSGAWLHFRKYRPRYRRPRVLP